MKTKSLAELTGMLEKNNLVLLGGGSFLDASNNTPFSTGTEGQLNGLLLDTCIEEAIEKRQLPAKQGCGRY